MKVPTHKAELIRRFARRPGTILTASEQTRLLGELSGEMHFKASFALASGLRWREINSLSWQDVDLSSHCPALIIERLHSTSSDKRLFTVELPLSPEALRSLCNWREYSSEAELWVFPRSSNRLCKAFTQRERYMYRNAAQRADIHKLITPYIFRRTYLHEKSCAFTEAADS